LVTSFGALANDSNATLKRLVQLLYTTMQSATFAPLFLSPNLVKSLLSPHLSLNVSLFLCLFPTPYLAHTLVAL